MPTYYELMQIIWKDGRNDNQFKNGLEMDTAASNEELDTESETLATATGIISWLLKNDISVKGKYTFRKKK